jgi:hypothetical protein
MSILIRPRNIHKNSKAAEKILNNRKTYVEVQNTEKLDFFGGTLFPKKDSAGPRGFEPPFSGSEGQRLNPDWATGPKEE